MSQAVASGIGDDLGDLALGVEPPESQPQAELADVEVERAVEIGHRDARVPRSIDGPGHGRTILRPCCWKVVSRSSPARERDRPRDRGALRGRRRAGCGVRPRGRRRARARRCRARGGRRRRALRPHRRGRQLGRRARDRRRLFARDRGVGQRGGRQPQRHVLRLPGRGTADARDGRGRDREHRVGRRPRVGLSHRPGLHGRRARRRRPDEEPRARPRGRRHPRQRDLPGSDPHAPAHRAVLRRRLRSSAASRRRCRSAGSASRVAGGRRRGVPRERPRARTSTASR